MIVYKKRKSSYILFLAIAILLVMALPLNIKYYQFLNSTMKDKIETEDVGFSSINNLIGSGGLSSSNIVDIVKKAPELISNYLKGVENRPEIPKINITIKFKYYKKILEDRKRFIKDGIASNFRQVKCKLNFNNTDMKAKLRLKGDLRDHWRSLTRLSFRVNIKSKNTIFGYKTFSLQKASARQFPYDDAFQKLQNNIGNLSAPHKYVHVYVNSEDWGIMDIEEHMSKELLEKQETKESLIFKFGTEEDWKYNMMAKNPFKNYRLSDEKLNVKVYKSKKYLENKNYRKWYSYVANELLNENSEIYDNNSFIKSMLLSMAWNTTHVLDSSNSRYYFSPYTLKIYPITTDQGYFSKIDKPLHLPNMYKNLQEKIDFNTTIKNNIEIVGNKLSNLQQTIDTLQTYFPMDKKINAAVVLENFNKIKNDIDAYILDNHDTNTSLVGQKPTKKQAKELIAHIHARHFENGEIHIYNLLPDDVMISEIYVDNHKMNDFNVTKLNGFKDKDYDHLTLKTNLKGIYDNKIDITTQYQGYKRTYRLNYTHVVDNLVNPLLKDTNLSSLEMFSKINEKTWKIKKGEWLIDKAIVINSDLEIEANTILKFTEDTYMIVKGSIHAIGELPDSIVFKADNERWKGIYVLNANNKSILKNVRIQDTKALTSGLLNLTGGVNFYKSDVDIVNTKFINSIAEDSLNIVHANFYLDNILIDNSISDGFDSDFSIGTIINSRFESIFGDAVDFSGSKVKISNCSYYNIHDKAVSSGEASNLDLHNLSMDNVGVAVASKDGSITVGNDINITNYKLNALMTYTKKSFYNKPKLELNNVAIDKLDKAYSRQENTLMIINNKAIESKKIDVKKMYKSGVMKK